MRKKITKLFWIWQLEKEQAWVNEMASHGYALEHAGRLTFEFDETVHRAAKLVKARDYSICYLIHQLVIITQATRLFEEAHGKKASHRCRLFGISSFTLIK